MHTIQASDVNDALYQATTYLLRSGVEEQSRNGPVLAAPEPVSIEYTQPRNRVVYSATRDANPFFHFFESIWMISGNNDIEFPCYFNSTYGQFSDDGSTMWDAYGWRWRKFFGWDQLDAVVKELKEHPESRRCVISMWNAANSVAGIPMKALLSLVNVEGAASDNDFYIATHGGKAVPCNTHCYVAIRSGKLNLMVSNRSNDLFFGCMGANVVHMSLLQEYLAAQISVPVGTYHQVTNNLHAYLEKFDRAKMEQIAHESDTLGRLPLPGPSIEPGFDDDLRVFMQWARALMHTTENAHAGIIVPPQLSTKFMADVAVPMFMAWVYRKWHDAYNMNICLDGIEAPDWRRACTEWVLRRKR